MGESRLGRMAFRVESQNQACPHGIERMEPERRYQIISTIGSGDFATVYRARDVELERDVAIKQIHSQFMQDPRQLDRYWHEAQILANLHHQYIMTIYDIVRGRGWLILELMKGALAAEMQGRPIDVETLRIALTQSLHALDFLHTKGILHGDVKPGNLLISANNRLKLGDFGLARRAGNAEGSLLKGTAKYMAPEVMSEQFGPVGPASDLYSLGFTAYELLCGEHFESLFPGLNSFGRDKPVAWMMWHAAPDRRLPEIGKVLEGVPPQLAAVIEKLIVKDPARRYRSAGEALEDLKERPLSPTPTAQFEAEAAAAAEQAKRKRRWAMVAFATSLVVTLGMAFLPLGRSKPPTPSAAVPDDVREGKVKEVSPDKHQLIIELKGDRKPLPIIVPPECVPKLSDGEFLPLRDVLPNDEVAIQLEKRKTKDADLVAKEVLVYRPETQLGRVREVDVKNAIVELDVEVEGGRPEVRVFTIPEEVKPLVNGERMFAGQTVTLATLKKSDRIEIQYFRAAGEERRVSALSAFRTVQQEGIVSRYDPERRILELADGPGGGAKVDSWPVDPTCVVTLDGRFAEPRDLVAGDRVTVARDTKVLKIEITRPTVAAASDTETPPSEDNPSDLATPPESEMPSDSETPPESETSSEDETPSDDSDEPEMDTPSEDKPEMDDPAEDAPETDEPAEPKAKPDKPKATPAKPKAKPEEPNEKPAKPKAKPERDGELFLKRDMGVRRRDGDGQNTDGSLA